MANKSISGKQATLYNSVKGTLIEGDGLTALADVSWFMISAVASTGSALPIGEIGAIFKTPDSGNAITPATGDDVFPLTLTQICKTDLSVSETKGTIDVTDDCEGSYNAMIVDGFTDISGSVNGFMKFVDPTGGLATTQKEILSRFFDIVDDDGAGNYTVTSQNDDDFILQILMDATKTATGEIQSWMNIPAILAGTVTDKPLKGVQNLDLTWNKAQGHAAVYQRTLNSED